VSISTREHSRLVWLTEHDYLTGMPNRSKLESSIAESLISSQASGDLMSFSFIDIDYFKEINDTYGHDAGDALLVNFVKRIRHSLPESALVARISGDEFGILLTNLKSENHLKELIDEVFSAMQRPFNRGEVEFSITCSAGCVLTNGWQTSKELMKLADQAMYQSKQAGRNRYKLENLTRTI
jgi:diguanylate cyclase (GGDEF)-like protein